jgi:hypothetical protein
MVVSSATVPRRWPTALLVFVVAITQAAVAEEPGASPHERAVEAGRSAKGAFESRDFRTALEAYELALSLEPSAVLHFNVARCHEELSETASAAEAVGHLDAAIEQFEIYLAAEPSAPEADAIRARIEKLRHRRDALLPSRVERSPEVRVIEAPPKISVAPWVLGGFGVAGVIAGGVLGGLHLDNVADLEAIRAERSSERCQVAIDRPSDCPSARDAEPFATRANAFAAGADVAFALGGLLAATGVVWGIIDVVSVKRATAQPRSTTPTLEILPGPRPMLRVLF